MVDSVDPKEADSFSPLHLVDTKYITAQLSVFRRIFYSFSRREARQGRDINYTRR